MSENEIPLGFNDFLMPRYFYRVSILGIRHESQPMDLQPVNAMENFMDPDLLSAKQKALAFLTEAINRYLQCGIGSVNNQYVISPMNDHEGGLKFRLSLVKWENDKLEEFVLIGAPEDKRLDSIMEEEVALAIHRLNNHKVR